MPKSRLRFRRLLRLASGFAAIFYQSTARAYLAMLLKRIDIDEFVEKATDFKIPSALATSI